MVLNGLDKTYDPQSTQLGGTIVVMGTASPLCGTKRAGSYSSAKDVKLAFSQSAVAEISADNVQLNAVTKNFATNPTYFPPEVQANTRFQERLKREVTLVLLVKGKKTHALSSICDAMLPAAFSSKSSPCSGN